MRRSLTRHERLRGRQDIENVFHRGSAYRCRGLAMKCSENGLTWSRVLVVSPRSVGKAVRRNRLRRIGKEIFRTIKYAVCDGYDFVFVVYPGDYSFGARRQQFIRVLSDANLLTIL
ncbi:MAG: ribonuclease P protein component [Spirochaetaceae bacterium]|nr:MAG: ribonuclease P protein component [Spirochaetaceae bacterium]